MGGGDSFALARADVFALRFGDEREYLQHQVGDEHGKQSARRGRVEKRHVENAHMDLPYLHEPPPFGQDLLIVPTKSVDARYDQQIAGLEFPHEPFPRRSVEVFAALVVGEDVLRRDACRPQGDKLPILVLFVRRDSRVAVGVCDKVCFHDEPFSLSFLLKRRFCHNGRLRCDIILTHFKRCTF